MAALRPYVGVRGLRSFQIVGLEISSKRDNHNGVVKDQYDNLAAYSRGKGGRASFNGVVATVFGCSGFLGRNLTHRLGKVGSQVICPYRGDPYYIRPLKLSGELGQILFLPFDLKDEETIAKAVKYSNVVINLVGRDWETKNFKFHDVHVEGARRIARIARESGVERFIHVSHLLAQPNPKKILLNKPSQFLISKYEGELAVKEEFPGATIFRPSDIIGENDRFLHYYSNRWRRQFGCLPLWKRGEKTIKSPVFVSDVVEGIVASIMDPSSLGKSYDCVGPYKYQLSELVDYFYNSMRYEKFKRIPITPLFTAKVKLMAMMPSRPPLDMEKLEREHIDDKMQSLFELQDLGVVLTPLEGVAEYELRLQRRHSYYREQVGEFPDPPLPHRCAV